MFDIVMKVKIPAMHIPWLSLEMQKLHNLVNEELDSRLCLENRAAGRNVIRVIQRHAVRGKTCRCLQGGDGAPSHSYW